MPIRDTTLNALVSRLRQDRTSGRDVLEITGHWSREIRERLDTNLAATGSTGRGEATPSSDLDVIRLSPGPTPRFDALRAAGVRVDANGALPTARELPTTEDQWRTDARGWISRPREDKGVVKIGLLADAHSEVRSAASRNFAFSPILADMLRDALSVVPPRTTGLWSRKSVDLKQEILAPTTKIARWAALASGTTELSTTRRLTTSSTEYLDTDSATALAGAFQEALGLSLDLDLGIVDNQVFERSGRVMLTALPPDRGAAVRSATQTLRTVSATLRYLLTTSAFSVDSRPAGGQQ